jgi:sterol-4alpha-carboxylate 3-dehydrogenase (decarboxylating)
VAERSSIYGESKVAAERIVIAAHNTSSSTDGRDQMNVVAKQRTSDDLDEEVRNDRPQITMSTCVLRPSVVFGPGDNQLIPSIHACIAKGETRWRLGDGTNLWDTVYVDNLADAHLLAVENLLYFQSQSVRVGHSEASTVAQATGGQRSAAGEIFFIQNNEPISFRDFCVAIWKEFGHFPPAWEIRIPEGLGWMLGLCAEALSRIARQPTTLSRGSVMDACAMRYASGEKARSILGYFPRIGLEEGLGRSCRVSALN